MVLEARNGAARVSIRPCRTHLTPASRLDPSRRLAEYRPGSGFGRALDALLRTDVQSDRVSLALIFAATEGEATVLDMTQAIRQSTAYCFVLALFAGAAIGCGGDALASTPSSSVLSDLEIVSVEGTLTGAAPETGPAQFQLTATCPGRRTDPS
jgi:hypothetical protein